MKIKEFFKLLVEGVTCTMKDSCLPIKCPFCKSLLINEELKDGYIKCKNCGTIFKGKEDNDL